jgi:hypothetical protein
MCPAQDPPDYEDGWLCMLPAGHWGGHTFELVGGSPQEVHAAMSGDGHPG